MINTIASTKTVKPVDHNKAFANKMRRLIKSRNAVGKTLSANDFLDIDSAVVGPMFRLAIRTYGLRTVGRVKSARPGRKGAYIPSYAV